MTELTLYPEALVAVQDIIHKVHAVRSELDQTTASIDPDALRLHSGSLLQLMQKFLDTVDDCIVDDGEQGTTATARRRGGRRVASSRVQRQDASATPVASGAADARQQRMDRRQLLSEHGTRQEGMGQGGFGHSDADTGGAHTPRKRRGLSPVSSLQQKRAAVRQALPHGVRLCGRRLYDAMVAGADNGPRQNAPCAFSGCADVGNFLFEQYRLTGSDAWLGRGWRKCACSAPGHPGLGVNWLPGANKKPHGYEYFIQAKTTPVKWNSFPVIQSQTLAVEWRSIPLAVAGQNQLRSIHELIGMMP